MKSSLKSLIYGIKSVPFVDVISEETREGINKAYIPKFLYKPPFGYPRFANINYVRYLAKTPYVEMCLKTIIDEITSIEWDIIPNPDIPETIGEGIFYDEEGGFLPETEAEINHIKSFLQNPNTNFESFEDVFVKQGMRDVLEVNTGIVNKVYNLKGDMVELVARDGGTFTKNPDIHGMYTNRADLLIPKNIVDNAGDAINSINNISSWVAREQAAYFQYGWISGPVPVPFGKKEIVWMQDIQRTDDIYGYSPIQVLANTLQMLLYQIESDLDYYNNNNVPKGIIGIDASDADEIKSFKEQWYDNQKTKDSFGNWKKMMHKVPILNYIPKFERIEFSSSEIQLIEKQKWYTKMVWSMFGVTPTELGYTEDAKGVANQIVQSKTFRKKAINPKLRMIEKHVNREVVSEFEYTIDVPTGKKSLPMPKYIFQYSTFDIDEEKSKAELHETWIRTGMKTVNEIRIEEGNTPVEWGDNPPSGFTNPSDQEEDFTDKEDDAQDTDEDMNEPKTNDPKDPKKKKEEKGQGKKKPKKEDPEFKASLLDLFSNMWSNVENFLKVDVPVPFKMSISDFMLEIFNKHGLMKVKTLSEDELLKTKGIFKRAIVQNKPVSTIVTDMKKIGIDKDIAKRIVRTEMNTTKDMAKIESWKASGMVKGKKWSARLDKRTSKACRALDGQVRGLDEEFFVSVGTTTWSGLSPSQHPYCRCVLKPVVG